MKVFGSATEEFTLSAKQNFIKLKRKVLHLEIKATGEHKYYGSLVALWNDNDGFPYHRVKRLNLSKGWENEVFKIRLGTLLTPSEVEAVRNNA